MTRQDNSASVVQAAALASLSGQAGAERHRMSELAALYRKDAAFAYWAAGYGVITHDDQTQTRVHALGELLVLRGVAPSREWVYRVLAAADRLASMGLWLVVHSTYAHNVYRDGRDLGINDFKRSPEGAGGALNLVPAYVGYLTANVLCGVTRAWLAGQGHSVAALDAINLLVGNLLPVQAERYDLSDRGLTRFVRDAYSYAPDIPRASHVSAYTAGAIMSGGHLGLAEQQYVHMPLRGERLVAFLSDGGVEEQRGTSEAGYWWRGEDSGLVCPIILANGRRLDRATTRIRDDAAASLAARLSGAGVALLAFDGTDPAAFAWAICEMEERLSASEKAISQGHLRYPVALPLGLAQAPIGFGFPGAGSEQARQLPLGDNPAFDEAARAQFNRGARQLWVPPSELEPSQGLFATHERVKRPRERDHALGRRRIATPHLPEPPWHGDDDDRGVPLDAIDHCFANIVTQNPELRPRVGNPGMMHSACMGHTLELLKHRVCMPEPRSTAEAVLGKVVTTLDEEAAVCAALGNKGGINLVLAAEAFAPKMLRALRQELAFSRQQKVLGHAPGWLSVPLIVCQHIWENGKSDRTHQDPSIAEAMLGQMSDVSRVLFPADCNSALAAFEGVYCSRGEIWTLVMPEQPVLQRFTRAEARQLAELGAVQVRSARKREAKVVLTATGAYQLAEAVRLSDRLNERGIDHSLVYLLEPGRFRDPRDAAEARQLAPTGEREHLWPATADIRIFFTHTRPEALLGVLRPLDTGAGKTHAFGYRNQGGTLDVAGLLYVNGATWAHAAVALCESIGMDVEKLLGPDELRAIRGIGDFTCLW